MSANLEAKKQIVEEIKGKIEASKSVVFADYNKLTVLEATALRNKFRAANCEYKVYKNTLVRKAFNELGRHRFRQGSQRHHGDRVLPWMRRAARPSFAKAVKETPALADKIVPKCAYLDKAYVDKNGVKELAAIPSKEVLIAKCSAACSRPFPSSCTCSTPSPRRRKRRTTDRLKNHKKIGG